MWLFEPTFIASLRGATVETKNQLRPEKATLCYSLSQRLSAGRVPIRFLQHRNKNVVFLDKWILCSCFCAISCMAVCNEVETELDL